MTSATRSATPDVTAQDGIVVPDSRGPNPAVAAIAQQAFSTQAATTANMCGTTTVGTTTPSKIAEVVEKYSGLPCASPELDASQQVEKLCKEQSVTNPVLYTDCIEFGIPVERIRHLKCVGDVDPYTIFTAFAHVESLTFKNCREQVFIEFHLFMPNLKHLAFRNCPRAEWCELPRVVQNNSPLPALRELIVENCPHFTDQTLWNFVHVCPLNKVQITNNLKTQMSTTYLELVKYDMIARGSMGSFEILDQRFEVIERLMGLSQTAEASMRPGYALYTWANQLQNVARGNARRMAPY